MKWSTLRTIIALAASFGWPIVHLDVITTFLNGKLDEVIYMHEPPGYEVSSAEHLFVIFVAPFMDSNRVHIYGIAKSIVFSKAPRGFAVKPTATSTFSRRAPLLFCFFCIWMICSLPEMTLLLFDRFKPNFNTNKRCKISGSYNDTLVSNFLSHLMVYSYIKLSMLITFYRMWGCKIANPLPSPFPLTPLCVTTLALLTLIKLHIATQLANCYI